MPLSHLETGPEGIDRRLIDRLVRRFYALIRRDLLLGPIFNHRIADWPAHEARITRFWCSVMLMSGEYHGNPMRAHLDIPDLGRTHFDHWLALFDAAITETCTPAQAGVFQAKARRIAQAFQFARSAQSTDSPLLPAR